MYVKGLRHVKWYLSLCLMALMPFSLQAQSQHFFHYNCLAPSEAEQTASPEGVFQAPRMPRHLPSVNTSWDENRIYRQLVVLVSFSDRDFSMDNPQERYDSIFNSPGYNEGRGVGCVADYFRCQSGGLFNLQFDIYGPIKIENQSKGSDYGAAGFRKALEQLIDSLDIDMSVYDWNRNKVVNQVIFVYAGFGGNEDSDEATGCIWPNTAKFSSLKVDSVRSVSNYSASAELWVKGNLCGIGTICHEFSHSLGLPDIYPTSVSATEYSVVDEWDLMDGGNFTDSGWCPPNYSALEKKLLGWLTPTVLDKPSSIDNLLAVSEGGEVYQVKYSEKEYYLLENRQWSGWDAQLPGHGLLISHVDYDASSWSSNGVNNSPDHHRYDLKHADNLNYDGWKAIVGKKNPYTADGHNRILSGSPYPYIDEENEIENRRLTDDSEPAATIFNGEGLMSKPITKITESEAGVISFDFMGGYLSTIEQSPLFDGLRSLSTDYDLQGRRYHGKGIRISQGKKYLKQQ